MNERRGLGRGLSALMSDVNLGPGAEGSPGAETRLPIERLRPNPAQPRRAFERSALESLAESIAQKGIIQPLIVRPAGDGWEIVAGERRWRAAQMARLHEVPAIVRDLDDVEVLEVAIIENIQREDLNAIEEAEGLRQLIERFGHTQERVAEALSRSRSHVANLLRLLTLPESVQAMVREGVLTAGHARALVGQPDAETIAREIASRGLSVRETERLLSRGARAAPGGGKASGKPAARGEKDADTLALEQDLAANLGMAVSIDDQGGRGTLTVRYAALDELDLLCQLLSAAGTRLATG